MVANESDVTDTYDMRQRTAAQHHDKRGRDMNKKSFGLKALAGGLLATGLLLGSVTGTPQAAPKKEDSISIKAAGPVKQQKDTGWNIP